MVLAWLEANGGFSTIIPERSHPGCRSKGVAASPEDCAERQPVSQSRQLDKAHAPHARQRTPSEFALCGKREVIGAEGRSRQTGAVEQVHHREIRPTKSDGDRPGDGRAGDDDAIAALDAGV